MTTTINTASGAFDLSELEFSAKIDRLSLGCPGKRPLPILAGSVKWHIADNHRGFTVHDAEPADIAALCSAGDRLPLTLLEVAVDIHSRCSRTDPVRARTMLAAIASEYVPKHLEPSKAPFINTQYRAFRAGSFTGPFNQRLPPAGATLYYGHRNHPVQVKSYFKVVDQGVLLPESRQVVRVEVTLKDKVLDACGLVLPQDLLHFRLRRGLSPYFTFMQGVRRKAAGPRDVSAVVDVADLARRDRDVWDKYGVGGFLPGGKGDVGKVCFLRNQEVNARVGQSLGRLEQQLGRQIRVLRHRPDPRTPSGDAGSLPRYG